MAEPITRQPFLHLARAVIELRTPLSLGTGNPDGVFDTALLRDANGLPAISATSLAGSLRSLYAAEYGEDAADALFGWQRRDSAQASRVQIGWGAVLDSAGRAAWGLLLGDHRKRLENDPLLKILLEQRQEPLVRNRVRLTHKGAAADTGKFDRSVVPAGCRFVFELRLPTSAAQDPDWDRLLALLSHPGLRLGGATRAGLGAVRCVSVYTACFDLRDPQQAAALGRLGADPSQLQGLHAQTLPENSPARWGAATLHLTFDGLWRVGGEGVPTGFLPDDKEPDLAPVREARIVWTAGKGELLQTAQHYLPAASLKGVLAHRMAFHARRFAGQWIDPQAPAIDPPPPAEVRALFGDVKSGGPGRGGTRETGAAGALFIDDAWVQSPPNTALLTHNAIDRFTGGVLEHKLFTEQVAAGGALQVRIALDAQRLERNAARYNTSIDAVRRALTATLDDLCAGRLALGARSTTGLGFCSARIDPAPSALWAPLEASQPQAA